jgi:hypothetical protein
MVKRLALGLLAVTLAGSACSSGHTETSPRSVPLPRVFPGDSAQIRAGKLASYIERRWPGVTIPDVEADDKGTVVQFQDQPKFDYSIKDPDAYEAHVKKVTGDLVQASVELLKLSMKYFPNLQYASVYQDAQLKAYWSKESIDAMGSPEMYRSYPQFLKLVMTAQFPPLGGQPPPAPTS